MSLQDKMVPEEAANLIGFLRALGATKIICEYSGGGDNGGINEIRVLNAQDKKISVEGHQLMFSLPRSKFDWATNTRTETRNAPVMTDVDVILHGLCYEKLDAIEYDWINNDGGSGVLKVDLLTNTATIKHLQNIMTTEESEYEV